MKRKQIFGMGLAMAVLAVSGCQKSPEKSIVINKDFNKMVEQAQAEDQGVSEVAELLAQNPESDYYIWQNSMTEISSIFDGVLVDNEKIPVSLQRSGREMSTSKRRGRERVL